MIGKARGWKRPAAKDPRDWALPLRVAPLNLPDVVQLPLRGRIPVRDQGPVGACTAFANVAAVEYLDLMDDGNMRDFAERFVYWASRFLAGVPASEDTGSDNGTVLRALRTYGVCEEAACPYGSRGSLFASAPSPEAKAQALEHRALFHYDAPNVRRIREALAHGLPVVLGFNCYPSLDHPDVARSGRIPFPTDAERSSWDGSGHDVLVVGYDWRGAEPVFNIRNSWSEAWGDGGYGELPARYVDEDLAGDAKVLSRVML